VPLVQYCAEQDWSILLPLLLFVNGRNARRLLAAQIEQRDVYAAIGALSGLVSGFVFAKWTSSHRPHRQNLP